MGRTSNAREKLLEVAFEQIWAQSYGAVSVDQICLKANVKKGSFYHFFPSKSDLASAALEEYWKSCQPSYEQIFSKKHSPLDRIKSYCQMIVDLQTEQFQLTGRVRGCPYASAGSELSTQNETLRAKCAEMFDRTSAYMESALRDAAEEGTLSPVDFKRIAESITAYIMGTLLHAKMKNNVNVLQKMPVTVLKFVTNQ